MPGCGGAIIEPALDPDKPERWHRFQIARLYRAYYDRALDAEGWDYWNKVYAKGATLAQISQWFADGSEFSRLGDKTNREFLDFVYRNVLFAGRRQR